MAQSVYTGYNSPFVPLGIIQVPTPGTPVRFTNLIDSLANNAPETFTPGFSANNTGKAVPVNDYTVTCQQIIIQGYTQNAGTGAKANTGLVYVMLRGAGGLGNRTDYGAMVCIVGSGLTATLTAAAMNMNVLNPYTLFLDADTANDGALITLVTQ